MKKNLSDSLRASLDEERKAVKSKGFNNLENRIAKAEAVFDKEPSAAKIEKVIRDTFSIPEKDYQLLEQCKNRALTAQYAVNKSEIVRAGLILLSNLPEEQFINALQLVKKIKTGRPKQ